MQLSLARCRSLIGSSSCLPRGTTESGAQVAASAPLGERTPTRPDPHHFSVSCALYRGDQSEARAEEPFCASGGSCGWACTPEGRARASLTGDPTDKAHVSSVAGASDDLTRGGLSGASWRAQGSCSQARTRPRRRSASRRVRVGRAGEDVPCVRRDACRQSGRVPFGGWITPAASPQRLRSRLRASTSSARTPRTSNGGSEGLDEHQAVMAARHGWPARAQARSSGTDEGC